METNVTILNGFVVPNYLTESSNSEKISLQLPSMVFQIV